MNYVYCWLLGGYGLEIYDICTKKIDSAIVSKNKDYEISTLLETCGMTLWQGFHFLCNYFGFFDKSKKVYLDEFNKYSSIVSLPGITFTLDVKHGIEVVKVKDITAEGIEYVYRAGLKQYEGLKYRLNTLIEPAMKKIGKTAFKELSEFCLLSYKHGTFKKYLVKKLKEADLLKSVCSYICQYYTISSRKVKEIFEEGLQKIYPDFVSDVKQIADRYLYPSKPILLNEIVPKIEEDIDYIRKFNIEDIGLRRKVQEVLLEEYPRDKICTSAGYLEWLIPKEEFISFMEYISPKEPVLAKEYSATEVIEENTPNIKLDLTPFTKYELYKSLQAPVSKRFVELYMGKLRLSKKYIEKIIANRYYKAKVKNIKVDKKEIRKEVYAYARKVLELYKLLVKGVKKKYKKIVQYCFNWSAVE